MRANKAPVVDLDKLESTVRERPGISSLELGREILKLCITARHRQAFIYKQSMKYLDMGDASPIFFQKIGGKKLWYTMEYAVRNGLESKPPRPDPTIDESLIVKTEIETLTIRRALIDSCWIHQVASV